jgi:hypothetical protein
MLTQFAEIPSLINSMNSSIHPDTWDTFKDFCSYEQSVLPLDGLEA